MSNLAEINTETEFEDRFLNQTKKKPGAREKYLLLTIIFCFLLLSHIGLTYYVYQSQKNDLADTNDQLIKTKGDLKKTQDSLVALEKKNESDLSKLDSLAHQVDFSIFQHELEQGLVTDDFVVDKASFHYDAKAINATIDIDTQPTMSTKYKGKGSFDISDRELKGKMQDLMTQIADAYAKYFDGVSIPDWKTGVFTITIKNFEIGTYSNGQFKLKGE